MNKLVKNKILWVVLAVLSLVKVEAQVSKEGTPTITRGGSSRSLDVNLKGSDGSSLTLDNGRIPMAIGGINTYKSVVTITNTTETTLIPAVAAIKHSVLYVYVVNNSTTDRVSLTLRESTGGTSYPLGSFLPNAGTNLNGLPIRIDGHFVQSIANQNVTIQATGTSPNVTIWVVSVRLN